MSEKTDSPDEIFGKIFAENQTDEAAADAQLRALSKVLKTLSPREQDIIKLRYGLLDGKVHTLAKIGEKYSVTRERIRQIEAKALAKIRLALDSPAEEPKPEA